MKNKSIAVIMNTNQLGGAERSLGEQLALVQTDIDMTFFIPKLGGSDLLLRQFLESKGFSRIEEFGYPAFLYGLSRKNFFKVLLVLFYLPDLLMKLLQWRRLFKTFDTFYVNGNKAFLPFFMWSVLSRRRCKVYWHFRDFPSPRAFRQIGRWLPRFTQNFKTQTYVLIGNSRAVEVDLKKFFPYLETHCLYNLSGLHTERREFRGVKIIGVASMFASWKGLHSVILMASLYEKELRELGVEEIRFYGKDIYLTAAGERSYERQIRALTKKLNCSLVRFPGLAAPGKIFSEIDVLLHPSLEPEPFGRVILEAFASGIPVLSSGLGGAGELVGSGERGFKFESDNYAQIFALIKYVSHGDSSTLELLDRAFKFSQDVEITVKNQVQSLLK